MARLYNNPLLLFCVVLYVTVRQSQGWLFPRSSSSKGRTVPPSYPHDIVSGSELTSLYNTPVIRAEHWERPLDGATTMVGPFRHTGVVVTTSDGQRWLIHKGDEYGRSSQTVVVNADYMSSAWRYVEGHAVRNSRVSDYVSAGGQNYDLLRDNCHSGRCRMMQLP